ncbi:MAG: DUF1566 domain-containing protein, partial [Candidatus Pacebacteria bacterium]|nr:DUF1566 domain-containing protein [Candidatus Paceibacterota bacterium]
WTGLTDFILPPESKVEDGYAYGPNGSLEGSAPAGAAPLEWSAGLGSMTWDNAVAYCANPANGYTRLPKIGELLNALSQQFAEVGTEGPGGFAEDASYWSDTEYVSGSAWYGNFAYGNFNSSNDNKSSELSVRCVR